MNNNFSATTKHVTLCHDPERGHKENRTPRLQYGYIFTRTADSYKNIGREASSHNRTGARLASGSRLYLFRAPPNGQVWHKAFFQVGPGARPEPTRAQHFLKIPTALSVFPLLWAPNDWSGSRKPSGSRLISYCCVFRYYGEWLSTLVGDSAITL